jgi:hypothetical protein
VLDFALGLEPRRRAPTSGIRNTIRGLVDSGSDPLGYYSIVLAGCDVCTPSDAERIWMLYESGLVSAQVAALALARSGYTGGWAALVRLLLETGTATADNAVFEALAWCGPPGRSALAGIITTNPNADGASAALHRVDPDAAFAAVEARIAAGLSLTSSDSACLREVGAASLQLLLAAARRHPQSGAAARAVGLTRRPEALQILRKHLRYDDPVIRHAAMRGISAWYGNALDSQGFDLIRRVALTDADYNLRLVARGTLETVGLSLPWVARAIDDLFEPLHDSDEHTPMRDISSIAERLWPVGPATHKAVVMLQLEPRLRTSDVDGPLSQLAAAGLAGELDTTLTADVARLLGTRFIDAALGVLLDDELSGPALDNLVVGMAFAAGSDADVYDTLVSVAGRHQSHLIEAALMVSNLPAVDRIQALAMAMSAMERSNRSAVQIWTDVTRRLLETLLLPDRVAVRDLCDAATRHVLSLRN